MFYTHLLFFTRKQITGILSEFRKYGELKVISQKKYGIGILVVFGWPPGLNATLRKAGFDYPFFTNKFDLLADIDYKANQFILDTPAYNIAMNNFYNIVVSDLRSSLIEEVLYDAIH